MEFSSCVVIESRFEANRSLLTAPAVTAAVVAVRCWHPALSLATPRGYSAQHSTVLSCCRFLPLCLYGQLVRELEIPQLLVPFLARLVLPALPVQDHHSLACHWMACCSAAVDR